MNVFCINKNNHFTAGLNESVIKKYKNADSRKIEFNFKEYSCDANFKNNKDIAVSFALTLNIFEDLSRKFKFPFDVIPPRIRTFNCEELVGQIHSDKFCLADTRKVLKNDLPFEMRSIFFKNKTIREIDNEVEQEYYKNNRSSSYFLADFIHEWLHNIHLHILFERYGYEGNCPYCKLLYNNNLQCGLGKIEQLSTNVFTNEEKNMLQLFLGNYAAKSNSIMEVFAEVWTQLITENINDKKLLLENHPFKNLSRYPKFIQKIALDYEI